MRNLVKIVDDNGEEYTSGISLSVKGGAVSFIAGGAKRYVSAPFVSANRSTNASGKPVNDYINLINQIGEVVQVKMSAFANTMLETENNSVSIPANATFTQIVDALIRGYGLFGGVLKNDSLAKVKTWTGITIEKLLDGGTWLITSTDAVMIGKIMKISSADSGASVLIEADGSSIVLPVTAITGTKLGNESSVTAINVTTFNALYPLLRRTTADGYSFFTS